MGREHPSWRTIAIGLLGLVWLILWWALLSDDHTEAQRLAVTMASILGLGGLWVSLGMSGWPVGNVTKVAILAVAALGLGMIYLLWGPWNDLSFGRSLVIVIVVVIAGAVVTAPIWIWRAMTWKVTVEAKVDVVVKGTATLTVEEVNEGSSKDDD